MLEFLDQIVEDKLAPKISQLETAHPAIPNGFHTISFPDGSQKTFRIRTKPIDSKFAPGKRVIGLLIGPDNTSDYEDFAFLFESGAVCWKRFRNGKHQEYAELLVSLHKEPIDGYNISIEKRCLVCNRTLTDPESIRLGIGPVCRGG